MNISYNNFTEAADRYLREQMDNTEREAFEARLATDIEFRQMFEQHSAMAEGLQRHFFQEKLEAYMKSTRQPEKVEPISLSFSIWKIVGVAAVVVLVLLWAGKQLTTSNPAKIEPKPNPVPQAENIQYLKEEQLAGDFTLDRNIRVPVRKVEVKSGQVIATETGEWLQLIAKQSEGRQPAYLASPDSVIVLLPDLKQSDDPKFTYLTVNGQKSLYLRLENQWYRISKSEKEKELAPEQDLTRQLWLNHE